jgi:hypothetical protein
VTNFKISKENINFLKSVIKKTERIVMSDYVSSHPNLADILNEITGASEVKNLETSTPSELSDHGLVILNNSDAEAFFWEVLYLGPSGQSKVDPFEAPSIKRKLLIQTIYEKNAS